MPTTAMKMRLNLMSLDQLVSHSQGSICGAASVGLLMLFVGCTTVSEKISGWTASNADVLAIKEGQIFRGVANFASARAASIQIQAGGIPKVSCFGPLQFTSTSGGAIHLSCSDGAFAVVPFHALSALSGTGKSTSEGASIGLTFGLSDEKAAAYLGVELERLRAPGNASNITSGER